MNYLSVRFRLDSYNEENAEILVALTEEMGFESYEYADEFLTAYIKEDLFNEDELNEILPSKEGGFSFNVSYTFEKVKNENWNKIWESNFQPIVIDDLCTVKASFHEGLPETKYTITIDPKMAFGTGHHQTTSLMMRALLKEDLTGRSVLDMGCGTGILAILAALKGGATRIVAIDIDPTATESAIENSNANRVGDEIEILTGDASLLASQEKFDLILANINRNIILDDIQKYSNVMKSQGVLQLSGFFAEDVDLIEVGAKAAGFEKVSVTIDNRWAQVKMKKK
ncbi:Ribosomal protein L11 methyltransferase [bioreactor metagenome]|uniref:Ribosomal protein L11 methyltransferase n=1 Tax=bioreactor metagenome TaxID=1076179 RepID=A0A645DRH1_9ZZZZ